MTVETLVNAVRENPDNFPNLCKITFYLYDDKGDCSNDGDIKFVDDLFLKNPTEKIRFVNFLNTLEETTLESLSAIVTESHVVIYENCCFGMPNVFSREVVPIDYMD